jgi:hypothetical protein
MNHKSDHRLGERKGTRHMADKAKGANAPGQQKEHEVFNPDGTPAGTMTQAEWRNRDKSLGLTRPDEDDAVEEAPAEGETAEG